MKKIIFSLFLSMMTVAMMAQGMTDSQVAQFIQREMKAGTNQSQIVTKLVQRGVKVDQIRRVKAQYEKQQRQVASDATTGSSNDKTIRLRQSSNAEQTSQEILPMEIVGDAPLSEMDRALAVQDSLNVSLQNTKKVFGRDIFNNRALSFEPAMNIATPQNYLVGPGDQIIVDVYGASQRTVSETVSPDGTITIPGYGPIQLAGLSVSAAKEKLRSTLGSRYSSSRINMTVGQTRSILINVMGEVKVPGTYTLSAFATVFHALYMAGGINDLGTLRNIKVFRGGHQISTTCACKTTTLLL